MLRKGRFESQNNNNNISNFGEGDIELPPEGTLRAILENCGKNATGTEKVSQSQIKQVRGKIHPIWKNARVLQLDLDVDSSEDGEKNGSGATISTLMKKSSPNEVEAYSSLFKDLQGHQIDNFVARPIFIQKAENLLFLENLESPSSGFEHIRSEVNYLDFNHSLLAVESLAKFHASSYSLRRQLGVKGKGKLELLQKYPFLNQQQSSIYSSRHSSKLSAVYGRAFDLVCKVVEMENPSLAFKLQRKVPDSEGIFDKIVKIMEEEKYSNDDFYVVCHGSFSPQNLLFSYDSQLKTTTPSDCRIVNFESVFFGPLASDLATFLLTSTTLEFRLEFEEKLLAFYCDAFQEQLNKTSNYSTNDHGTQLFLKPTEFEFDIDEFHRQLEKQYKKMLEVGFYNSSVLLPPLLFRNRNQNLSDKSKQSEICVNNYNYDDDDYSISGLIELLEGKIHEEFLKNEMENFVLNDAEFRERIMGILKQLAKCRVLL